MNILTMYEGKNQLKEYWRIYKYIQIKLHATEQARGQQKSKWKQKNTLRTENENKTYKILWDTTKESRRGTFIVINATSRNSKKKKQFYTSRNKKKNKLGSKLIEEIAKIREEINKIKTKYTIEKINENKSWFFEKKIDKLLARLANKKEGSNT